MAVLGRGWCKSSSLRRCSTQPLWQSLVVLAVEVVKPVSGKANVKFAAVNLDIFEASAEARAMPQARLGNGQCPRNSQGVILCIIICIIII